MSTVLECVYCGVQRAESWWYDLVSHDPSKRKCADVNSCLARMVSMDSNS